MQLSRHQIVRAEFSLQPTCAPEGMLTVIHGKELHVMKLVAQQIAFTVTQPLTSVEFPKTSGAAVLLARNCTRGCTNALKNRGANVQNAGARYLSHLAPSVSQVQVCGVRCRSLSLQSSGHQAECGKFVNCSVKATLGTTPLYLSLAFCVRAFLFCFGFHSYTS